MALEVFFASVLAYLFGSISSAIVVCKLLRLPDPRTQGSFNPGATNVLRIGGKGPALITLLGDVLKGTIPVLIAKWLDLSTLGLASVIFFAFIGHLFPVFFRFQGGKGVATALGALLGLHFPIGLCCIGTWLTMALLFRYSSLASLTAALLAPLYTWLFTESVILTITIFLLSLILIIRHQKNIENLLAGRESKIGKKK